MIRKHFRDVYLIGISFVAGVLFVIQCGGAAKSVAEAVTDALGITYSNSDSGLSATTVQAAIDELATARTELEAAIPFVYDASGNKIGVYVSNPGNEVWEMWDMTRRVVFEVEPAEGQVVVKDAEDTRLYFETTDCTGTVFLRANAVNDNAQHPVAVTGTLYKIKFGGATKTESNIKSTMNSEGTCASGFVDMSFLKRSISVDDAGNLDVVLVEAETIEEPSYTGPLFIK